MELFVKVELFIFLKISFWVKKGINTLNRLRSPGKKKKMPLYRGTSRLCLGWIWRTVRCTAAEIGSSFRLSRRLKRPGCRQAGMPRRVPRH